MRSKSIARRSAPPPASNSRGNSRWVLVGVGLILVGAVGALTIEHMPGGPAQPVAASARPSPTSTPAPVDTLAPVETPADTSAAQSEAPLPSDSPSPSPTPPSAALEAALPTQINGVALTVTSAIGATVLGNSPSVRALSAATVKLGASGTPLELGYAYDPTGVVDLNVLAFRMNGVAASVLEPVILNQWLSVGAPGVTVLQETLSGVPVRHISYTDKGAEEWVLKRGDGVFIVETKDKAIATTTIALLVGARAPSGNPVPSPSTSPGSSPQASPSP